MRVQLTPRRELGAIRLKSTEIMNCYADEHERFQRDEDRITAAKQ
jgi:hypothetical protein